MMNDVGFSAGYGRSQIFHVPLSPCIHDGGSWLGFYFLATSPPTVLDMTRLYTLALIYITSERGTTACLTINGFLWVKGG